MNAQVLRKPVVLIPAAVASVLLAAVLAGPHPATPGDIPLGHGAIVERAVPKLMLNVPHGVAQAVAQAGPAEAASFAPQIARSAKLSLYVGDIDRAVSEIGAVARAASGDVFSLDVSKGDGASSASAGSMEIRIPATRFDTAMSSVAAVGNVRERSVSAQDLTGSLTDSQARLRNLLQTEDDIRRIMDRSGSVEQVMDAENQLSQVRQQIEELESQIKSMRDQVAYATIDVDLQAETATVQARPTAASQLASAWNAAVAQLAQSVVDLVAALMWIAVFTPYAILAIAAWFGIARMRRRVTAR
jgi:hypothetical protein